MPRSARSPRIGSNSPSIRVAEIVKLARFYTVATALMPFTSIVMFRFGSASTVAKRRFLEIVTNIGIPLTYITSAAS
jgi:hypothetical protein